MLNLSKDLYVGDSVPIIDRCQRLLQVLFGVSFPVFLIIYLVLRTPIQELRNSTKRTINMLNMVCAAMLTYSRNERCRRHTRTAARQFETL